MKVLLNVCALFFLLGCNIFHPINKTKSSKQQMKFVEYSNNNTKVAMADGVTIPDKKFRLQIPESLNTKKLILGEAFVQMLSNNENEAIATVFIPGSKPTPVIDMKDISFDRFIVLCEKEGILSFLENDIKIRKQRRFGIYKPGTGQFYVIYLNVKRSDILSFNYSIASVRFD